MFAVIVTGPPGAGKSEVASFLHDLLGERGENAALVEVDALERSHPPIDHKRSIEHLRTLAGSYRELETAILVVTATIEDDAYRSAAVEAIGAEDVMVVRLEADPETLRHRILAREPPGWEELPELLNSSRQLAESMVDLGGVDLVLSTEGEQPGPVAERIEGEVLKRRG